MFSLLASAFLLLPSIAGTLYFLERGWLLIRAKDDDLHAVLDRDLDLGRELWISIRGLLAPPELF